jgi:hypothetical protein
MRLHEAMEEGGLKGAPASDREYRTTCPECVKSQTVDVMPVSEIGDVTTFSCVECGVTLIGIKTYKEGAEERENSGFRIGDYVIGSKAEIFLRTTGASADVRLPASPNFFT